MGEYKNIHLEKGEGVARLILDRPPVNILNIETMVEVNRALDELKEDVRLKVLVISGKGRAFSAGVDIADHTEDKVEEMLRQFHGIILKLLSLEAITVAAVHGYALGGGCELVIACDLIVAAEGAKFGQPEIKVGVFPPMAAIALPRLIPGKRALELLYTGDSLDAQDAFHLGLVSRVVPGERLSAEVDVLVSKITENSAAVLRLTKRAVGAAKGLEFSAAIKKTEDIYLSALMATEDAKEGLQAFLQKRKPVWKDR